jgi:L-alanine-DL-glutamate epimerase-like enolase superfamily enzyme
MPIYYMEKINKINLYFLDIPFRMDFKHASDSKYTCKNLIIEISSPGKAGYGEAVIRDIPDVSKDKVIHLFKSLLNKIDLNKITYLNKLQDFLINEQFSKEELPLICGIETAMLDLFCKKKQTNIFSLIHQKPQVTKINYNGTIPLTNKGIIKTLLDQFFHLGISTIRIKINKDPGENEKIIKYITKAANPSMSFFADANSSWTPEVFKENLTILKYYNIHLLEEPLADINNIDDLAYLAEAKDIKLIADQSVIDFRDLENVISKKAYSIINLRIGKVGGVFRCIKMIDKIRKKGLNFYLGCRVGETGILSKYDQSMGFLFPDYIGADHPFDFYLLTKNIINENTDFNTKGGITLTNEDFCNYTINREILHACTQVKTKIW